LQLYLKIIRLQNLTMNDEPKMNDGPKIQHDDRKTGNFLLFGRCNIFIILLNYLLQLQLIEQFACLYYRT
jgi:hypothetical protein